MNIIDDDPQYNDVIKTLKGLQKVSTPANFEANLMRKINTGKFEEKKSFWGKFLLPSRLIPSAALVLSAVVILFVVNTGNSGYDENPLLSPPRVREDVVTTSSQDAFNTQLPEVKQQEKAEPRVQKKSVPKVSRDVPSIAANTPSQEDSDGTLGITLTGPQSSGYGNPSIVSFGNPINKRGLNYMQRPLTREEKVQLELMKKRLQEMLKELNK